MFVKDVDTWIEAVKKAVRNLHKHWTDEDESKFWAANEQRYRDSYVKHEY